MTNTRNSAPANSPSDRAREIPIEIFRAGTHTPMSGAALEFSRQDIVKCADAYDPNSHEAPVVVGHPATDAPAYAWVKRLDAVDDKLIAYIGDIEPQFAELVKTKRYAKVSAAFYAPNSPGNPKPGGYTLKHVGFLGATPPSVKGLKPVQFASGSEDILSFGSLSVGEVEAFYQRQMARTTDEVLVEKLIGEGRLLPVHKAGVLAFMENLSATPTIEFADTVGGEMIAKPAADWFRGFLKGLAVAVVYGEIVGKRDDDSLQGSARAHLKVPAGFVVSKDNEELFQRATQIARDKGISFADAVQQLS